MHQPQFTQLLSPIGLLSSKEMLVRLPLPMRPMTSLWATSVQARTQRSQTMQALWSIAIDGLEKSVPFEYARGVNGDMNAGGGAAIGSSFFFALPFVFAGAAVVFGFTYGLSNPRRSPSNSSSQSWLSWCRLHGTGCSASS